VPGASERVARPLEQRGLLERGAEHGALAAECAAPALVELAASDMSNRQIAQALYLTEKTVETTSPTPTAS
jgi:hypothetical protein